MEPLTWTTGHKATSLVLSAGFTFMGIATDQWVVIMFGLAVGVLARAAYLLSMSKPVWRDFGISIVMAPMNGVLASELIESINLHDARLLLATSLLASTSTMLFVEARRKFIKGYINDQPVTQLFTTPDTITHVPTNSRPVDITSVGSNSPQTTGEVEIAQLGKVEPITDNGDALTDLLRKLDKE